jgi:hypothetical protein
MRRSLTWLVVLFLAAAVNSPSPAAAAASPRTEQLINEARAQYGLAPLRADGRLEAAAQYHNEFMAANSVFCHVCPGEPEPAQRLYNAGYMHNGFGEILAAGYQTPEDAVIGWLNSPGHKAQMLGAYRDQGCDMLYRPGTQWTWYFTCDFGNTNEDIPPATPRPSATWSVPMPTPLPTETRIWQPTIPTPRPFATRTPFPTRVVYPTPTRRFYASPTPYAPPTAQPQPTDAPPSGGGRVAYVNVRADRDALDLVSQLCAWNGGAECPWQPPNIVVRLRPDAQALAQRNFDRLCGSAFSGVRCE